MALDSSPSIKRIKRNRRFIIVPMVLLLILVIAIGAGTVFTRKLTISRMVDSLHQQVQNQASSMYDKIDTRFSQLYGFSAAFTEEEIINREFVMEKLILFTDNTDFTHVYFVNTEGDIYLAKGKRADISDTWYFQQCMNEIPCIERLDIDGLPKDAQIGFFVPVIFEKNIAGVLIGTYNEEQFQELFETTGINISGYSCLCDVEGNIIATTEMTKQELEKQKPGIIESGSLFEVFEMCKFSDGSFPTIEKQLKANEGGKAVYSVQDENRYTMFEPVGVNDWYVFTMLHEAQIYEEASENIRIVNLTLVAVMAAVVCIVIYVAFQERQQAALTRKQEEELRYVLAHDDLTGILTEKEFCRQLELRLPELKPREYCLIYMDVYKFKLVNEMFGYAKGDEFLTVLARELRLLAEEYNGLSGRISGDKFVLFLPYLDEVINLFYTRKDVGRKIFPIDIYLHYGIYIIEKTDMPAASMIDCAQLAQKTVKGDYDNYISYYDETLKQQILKEQQIINSMTRALANGEFVIYLQPQYSYRDGKIHGAEALVRWKSPTQGMIYPGDFIPVFERNGFILKLDENIWEQACQLLRQWIDEGREPLPISINVSRMDLLKGNVAEKLKSLIDEYNLTPNLLHVEITESAYMDNPQQLIWEINKLREYGFLVEMDDFGSGYSSLNMLKDLPIHVLKTDLKFLDSQGIEERRDQILDNVIKMAHEMGLIVVAEGVETKEQAEHLNHLDCEIMQGYYFAKPIPVEDFEKLAYENK